MARVMHITPPHTPAIVVIIPALAKPLRRLETDPAPKFHPSVRSCFTALLLRFALAPWRGCCIATGASLAIPWLPDGPFHVYQRGRSIAHGRRPAACLRWCLRTMNIIAGQPVLQTHMGWCCSGAQISHVLPNDCFSSVAFLAFFSGSERGFRFAKMLSWRICFAANPSNNKHRVGWGHSRIGKR